MHVPSLDEDRISFPNELKSTVATDAECCFSTPTRLWLLARIFHTLTWPSTPPLAKRRPLLDTETQVQPLLCAFVMVKMGLPVSGVKLLRQPSSQQEIMLFPSLANVTPVAVKFRTTTRRSSSKRTVDHRRMDS